MIKKTFSCLAIIALIAVIGFGITACSGGGAGGGGGTKGNPATSATYKGKDLAGNEYTLTVFYTSSARAVLKGDDYELSIKDGDGNAKGSTEGTIEDILDNKYSLSGGLDVVITGNSNISSIVGDVTLSNGSVFRVRTFSTIYLGANRWEQCHECNVKECGIEGHEIHFQVGEHYNSGNSVKLADLYSDSLDDFLSAAATNDGKVKLKITGTVNKKLENFGVGILCAWSYWPDPWEGRAIGGTEGDDLKPIGPGNFEVEILVTRWFNESISELPFGGGEVYIELNEVMFGDFPNDPARESHGTQIPANIPNGTIYATLTNITIEPVTD